MEDTCICKISDVTSWFPPDRLLFDHLDLSVKTGERILITGPAGSGKTTLIRLLTGELKPSEGGLTIGGRMAVIQERHGWMPSLNMLQHIALPLMCRGHHRKDSMDRAEQWLTLFGESRKGILKPEQMGGYERTLTALGQAAVQEADIIVADTFMKDLNPDEKCRILDMLTTVTEGRTCILMSDMVPDWPYDRHVCLK